MCSRGCISRCVISYPPLNRDGNVGMAILADRGDRGVLARQRFPDEPLSSAPSARPERPLPVHHCEPARGIRPEFGLIVLGPADGQLAVLRPGQCPDELRTEQEYPFFTLVLATFRSENCRN